MYRQTESNEIAYEILGQLYADSHKIGQQIELSYYEAQSIFSNIKREDLFLNEPTTDIQSCLGLIQNKEKEMRLKRELEKRVLTHIQLLIQDMMSDARKGRFIEEDDKE